ncbi:MAG: type IX secretion system protein PorQ [Bacteroidales bacterium]|nr:type IX secretion system protein PorQ [Bacteroidales bacterium]
MKGKRIHIILFFSLLLIGANGYAQTGGRSVYNFLSYSYASRVTALGSGLISVYDDDPTLLMVNPSYIGARHHNTLALDFTNYFAGTNYASALYSYTFPKAGSFAIEARYVNYGKFTGTDESGVTTGNFSVNDVALTLGWGRELSQHFSIGANLKFVYCGYESYHSFGLAADVASSFFTKDKNISLTLLAKNIGTEVKPFYAGNLERLPFDLQLAFSQRLAHVPIRYHISLHSLYRWNMNYYGADNPFMETDALTNTLIYPSKAKQFFDNFFRHIIFGLEIEPSKYFSIQLAYNHNIHQEMKVLARHSMAGFSYGFMLNIKGLRFGFSRLQYAPGAAPNCVNLALNFGELAKWKKSDNPKKLKKMN